jgi:hypothetical protein
MASTTVDVKITNGLASNIITRDLDGPFGRMTETTRRD